MIDKNSIKQDEGRLLRVKRKGRGKSPDVCILGRGLVLFGSIA